MTVRPLEVLLMASAGWAALAAAPAHSGTCDEQFQQVQEELAAAEISSSERREYQVLLEAAQAMRQNDKEQVCLDILTRTRDLFSQRASAASAAAAPKDAAAPLSQIARFEDVRELDVVNSKGEKLGKIVDLVLDFDDQELQYALLSMSSGFFGDDKLYPVPIDVLRIGDDPDQMRDQTSAAADPAMLPAGPSPATGDWQPTATAPAMASAPLAGADRPEGASELGTLAQMTVGELVGREVENQRDQSVGEVEALILPPGAVQVEAVLSVGGFLGLGDKEVAIPLSRLTASGQGLRFKTPVSEDELKALPEVEISDQDRLPDDTVIAALAPPPAPPSTPAAPDADTHSATAEARAAGAQPTAGQAASGPPSSSAQATATAASPARATAEAPVEQAAATSDAGDQPKDPLANKVLVLDIDRATLEQAPGFSEDAYPDLANAEWHRTVLAFYQDVLHIGAGSSTPPKQD